MLKSLFTIALGLLIRIAFAQDNWPAVGWDGADNLTNLMNSNGVNGLSGLYWNHHQKNLLAMQENGKLHVLAFNGTSFTLLSSLNGFGNPEGITQLDQTLNEIFTIDESAYEIRKYTCNSNYSAKVLSHSWNLLLPPSEMPNTGNQGPEGICFVPDAALVAENFISSKTGGPYVSSKGMGGLMFVANQTEGEIWVFDLNPNLNDDFNFVGKYKTNRAESCELAFDNSTRLMYILHNIGANSLEACKLSSSNDGMGNYKFDFHNEYLVANPTGNKNIEGFTLSPQCNGDNNMQAWLCRDVENTEPIAELKDCLRWFRPFDPGNNCNSSISENLTGQNNFQIQSAFSARLTISGLDAIDQLQVYTADGRLTYSQQPNSTMISIDTVTWNSGIYLILIQQKNHYFSFKTIK